MKEIKLKKRYPHIPDEYVTRIFQDGYMRGWTNARKKAIPIEFIEKKCRELYEHLYLDESIGVQMLLRDWEKENESNRR